MLFLARRHVLSSNSIAGLLVKHQHARSLWTSHLSSPVQSYLSTSTNALTNLSLEHHLLTSTDPSSTVLLFYTNTPTIVIGRNQNPWLETNLAALPQHLSTDEKEPLRLVRRRSGGGTVFHDAGNINWTVIVPPRTFKRDTHAEMVVRALRALGVPRARVNERHDIVLDQGPKATERPDEQDTHVTQYKSATSRPLKCSGSAFKLTRTRALHHGTCLLNSRNLASISSLLRSPGRGAIKALGVESVSSPVGNAGLSHADFIRAVRAEFEALYAPAGDLEHVEVGDGEALDVQAIQKGSAELSSAAWTFGQTPRFSVRASTKYVEGLTALAPLSLGVDVEKGRVKRLVLARSEDDGALEGPEASVYKLEEDAGSLYDDKWNWGKWIDRIDVGLSWKERSTLRTWMETILPGVHQVQKGALRLDTE